MKNIVIILALVIIEYFGYEKYNNRPSEVVSVKSLLDSLPKEKVDSGKARIAFRASIMNLCEVRC